MSEVVALAPRVLEGEVCFLGSVSEDPVRYHYQSSYHDSRGSQRTSDSCSGRAAVIVVSEHTFGGPVPAPDGGRSHDDAQYGEYRYVNSELSLLRQRPPPDWESNLPTQHELTNRLYSKERMAKCLLASSEH